MPAFIVATVRITDPERFAVYGKAIAGLSEQHGGEALVRGQVSEVFEGASPIGERVVVSRFPTAEAAKAYISSAAYQSAKVAREGAAEVDMRLVVT